MWLINGQPLYERFCDLEGGAMRHVSELYDKGKESDFKMWSVILAERTAYTHDIIDAPTIDAVPVVRCQECVFWNRERVSCEGLARCLTGESGIRYRTKDDYCSRGRRREDGDGDGI